MSAVPENGLVAIVKRDCPTCVMTAPVPLQQQIATEVNLVVERLSD